ncbi:hypothetical protein ABPG72_020934 [Tetrahymena utriculariae]
MKAIIIFFLLFISIKCQENKQDFLTQPEQFDQEIQHVQSKQKFLSIEKQKIPQEITQDNLQQFENNGQQILNTTNLVEQSNFEKEEQQIESQKIEKEIEFSFLFIAGLISAALGISFEWKNEIYYTRYLKLLDMIKNRCKTQDFAEGDLVFLSGKINYNYNLADPLFNLNIEKAVKIKRSILMVQYDEKNKTDDEYDENGNLKIRKVAKSPRANKNNYVKKWISYRVPVLNFKDQNKIQKSQKYCKFIAESDTFQINKISLSLPNNSPNLVPINSPGTPKVGNSILNFSNASNNQNEGANKSQKIRSSLKSLLPNSSTGAQQGSMTTPNATSQQKLFRQNSNLSNSHNNSKITITDLSCFDDFAVQQFNYNLLTNNEKELITNKIEDLRHLKAAFEDQIFDTYVMFKDDEVIISRKQDFQMHLGDNKMQHNFVYADEISIIGKLGSNNTLIPYYSIEENNEDIELDDMDDVNNSPLLRKRNKKIPLLDLKSNLLSTGNNHVNQESGFMQSSNERIRYNNNESTCTYYFCYLPRLMKTIFAFDDKVYWAVDRVVKLDQFLQIKKEQFSKLVKICRYISLFFMFLGVYLSILPILNAFGIINAENLEKKLSFITQIFVVLILTFSVFLSTAFPIYAAYKIHHGILLLALSLGLLYLARVISY